VSVPGLPAEENRLPLNRSPATKIAAVIDSARYFIRTAKSAVEGSGHFEKRGTMFLPLARRLDR
jgi:hypothetical protein